MQIDRKKDLFQDGSGVQNYPDNDEQPIYTEYFQVSAENTYRFSVSTLLYNMYFIFMHVAR